MTPIDTTETKTAEMLPIFSFAAENRAIERTDHV